MNSGRGSNGGLVADPIEAPVIAGDQPPAVLATPQVEEPVAPDLASQLERIRTLHRQGVLSNEEFRAAKSLLVHPPLGSVEVQHASRTAWLRHAMRRHLGHLLMAAGAAIAPDDDEVGAKP